jgi:pyruvate dehydrogenase E1 component
MLNPADKPRQPWVRECLGDRQGPFIAATDYMKTVADQIRQWVPGRYVALGTDGYGRSDSREALRSHFEVDRHWIVVAALKALADDGRIDRASVTLAMKKFGIDPDKPDPRVV